MFKAATVGFGTFNNNSADELLTGFERILKSNDDAKFSTAVAGA
jgi:hypothetical protein